MRVEERGPPLRKTAHKAPFTGQVPLPLVEQEKGFDKGLQPDQLGVKSQLDTTEEVGKRDGE